MPSVRHRSDRPTTSRRASRAASSTPCSPGRIGTDSVTIPTTCCTSIEARDKSLLASRRSTADSPRYRGAGASCRATGQARRRFDRGPVVLDASERRHERPGGPSPRPDEYGDVAGRVFEDSREILVGVAAFEAAPGRRREARDRRRTGWRVAPRPCLARPWCGWLCGTRCLARERPGVRERGGRVREFAVVSARAEPG